MSGGKSIEGKAERHPAKPMKTWSAIRFFLIAYSILGIVGLLASPSDYLFTIISILIDTAIALVATLVVVKIQRKPTMTDNDAVIGLVVSFLAVIFSRLV